MQISVISIPMQPYDMPAQIHLPNFTMQKVGCAPAVPPHSSETEIRISVIHVA